MQRPAKPSMPVRFRPQPPLIPYKNNELEKCVYGAIAAFFSPSVPGLSLATICNNALPADPQEAHRIGSGLVDQGQVCVAPALSDLHGPDGLDKTQDPMPQPPAHDPLDRAIDLVPGGTKLPGDIEPRELPCPGCEELRVSH